MRPITSSLKPSTTRRSPAVHLRCRDLAAVDPQDPAVERDPDKDRCEDEFQPPPGPVENAGLCIAERIVHHCSIVHGSLLQCMVSLKVGILIR